MASKKFLKPVSALVATLVASTLQSNANATALKHLNENAVSNTEAESQDGRPDADPLLLQPGEQQRLNLGHYSHSSHASHASHRSHYSGYTG